MAELPAVVKRVLFVVGHIRASNSAQGPCGFEALEPECTGIVTFLKLRTESEDSCAIDLAQPRPVLAYCLRLRPDPFTNAGCCDPEHPALRSDSDHISGVFQTLSWKCHKLGM